MFRSTLLTVNLFLLGLAGLFLGSQHPGGYAGRVLALACVLAQVLTIKTLVRSRRDRRQRPRSAGMFSKNRFERDRHRDSRSRISLADQFPEHRHAAIRPRETRAITG